MKFYDLLFYFPSVDLTKDKKIYLYTEGDRKLRILNFFYCHFAYKLKQYKIGVAVKGSLNEISRNLHQCIKFQF